MPQYTFNPGPSMVYPQVRQYLTDAYDEGILSISHRSPQFEQVYRTLDEQLRQKLNIPTGYAIYVLSSATEVWSVLSESLVERKSTHLFTGSFGERWHKYAKHIQPTAEGHLRDWNHDWLSENWADYADTELLCLTHNETARTAQVPLEAIRKACKALPDTLIAVDATSSLAGIELPIDEADIWFASVQKCFGLPAGLSVLIMSPRAQNRVQTIGFDGQYNSLVHIAKRYKKFQNTHTPNVLGIYLLSRLATDLPHIQDIDARVKSRMEGLIDVFEQQLDKTLVVSNPDNRSHTVLGVYHPEAELADFKQQLSAKGLQLGGGYGDLKPKSYRIANFPAIPDAAFTELYRALGTD